MLRLETGRYPDDPELGALVGELSIHSAEFRRLWTRNRVHRRTTGTKRYHHPLVGELTITYQALTPGDDPDQTIFVYDTVPASASANALRLLAGWGLTRESPHGSRARTGTGPADTPQRPRGSGRPAR